MMTMTMTICIGDVMSADQSHKPFVQASAGSIGPMQHMTSTAAEELQARPSQGLEEEWHGRLRSMQQWICELLIKNEQLRMSLESATALAQLDSASLPEWSKAESHQ